MSTPLTTREYARQYIGLGVCPIPVPAGTNKPILTGWPDLRVTASDVENTFGENDNIGLLNGAPSGGSVDVDLDCPEALAAAPLLPSTGRTSGRESAPKSHYWYKVNDPPAQAADVYLDPTPGCKSQTLVELRSTGSMTLVPPSIYPIDEEHPKPERCVWSSSGSAALVGIAELRQGVGAVAAAALLARYWPGNARHHAALALAGGLFRANWDEARVERFVRAVCVAARDEEVSDRLAGVRSTALAHGDGCYVTGWPELARLIGANGSAVVDRVRAWLGLASDTRGAEGARRKGGRRYTPLAPWRPFPVEHLPCAVRGFVLTVSEAMRCDPTFVALPALTVCAGMIGSTRVIRLKRSWNEPAMIWAAVIGDSGTLKTPPYKRAVQPVIDLQAEAMKAHQAACEAYRAELREYERRKKNARNDDPGDPPAQPPCVRIYSRDTTIEALSGLLVDNKARFLVGRDELSGWLSSFNQYKAKGGSDLANWLELHGLGTLCVDRKTGEPRTIFVSEVGVSLCGGVQPGVLQKALTPQHIHAGIPARLLFAYPPRRTKEWTEDDIDEAAETAYRRLVTELTHLEPHTDDGGAPYPVRLGLTPDAKAEWVRFYTRFAEKQAETDGELAAAFSKLEGYAARLALVHHVCQSVTAGSGALEAVTVCSVQAGIALAEWFTYEAERVYQMLGEETSEGETRKLVDLVARLASRHGGRLTARQLRNANGRKYRTTDAASAALDGLVELNVGRWEDVPAGANGGRPTRAFVPCPTPDETDETPEDGSGPGGGSGPPGGDTTPPRPTKPPENRPVENDTNPVGSDVSGAAVGCHGEVSSVSSGVGHENQADESCATKGPGCFVGPDGVVSDAPHALTTTAEGVRTVAEAVTDWAGGVGLDTETTGLDPARDRVRLIQLALGTEVVLIDVFALPDPGTALGPLFAALTNKEVVGHNLQFDLRMLAPLGFVPGRVFDTMLASRVLHAGELDENNARLKHGLAEAAERELGRVLNKDEQRSDWSGALTAAQLAYAAADAAVLLPLADSLKGNLAAAGLTASAGTEMRALRGVAWAAPVAVDVAAWLAIEGAADAERARLAAAMDDLVPNASNLPGMESWNWASAETVKKAFARVGVTVKKTDDDTLAGITHPLGGFLREYRAASKRVTTYGRTWVEKHVGAGDVVLPSWNQLGTATGRMSCSDPNLQQMPRDPRYRKCFVARPGRLLVKADYSQVELRVAAKVANEPVMTAAYKEGRDLHTLTAARILNKPEGEVKKADRQLAKAINFGLLYGMGWKSLKVYASSQFGVTLTDRQAQDYRTAFFKTYPALRAWHERTAEKLKRLLKADPDQFHEVRTLSGRQRLLPVAKRDANGNPYPNTTAALNTPVQGTAGDGLKVAIALLWERRAECPGAVPVLFVHDEIVLEVPEDDANRAGEWLRACMVEAVAPLIDPVPCGVDVSIGRTWGG